MPSILMVLIGWLNNDISMNGTHSIFAVALSNANGYGRILENDANLFFGIGNGNNNFATFYGRVRME